MSKENQNKKNDGQNRCGRCDRPLKDPTANYGWWCAQIVQLDRYKQIVSSLDENAMDMYNRYIVDYLYKDGQTPVNNVAVANYNDQEPTNQGTTGILNTGYDEAGEWHDWDAERYGTDSPADGVNEIKDRSGEVKEAVTIYGDRRWENGEAAYDRFVWCDVPNTEAGKHMFQYAVDMFVNPGDYNLLGQQCDYVASKILSAGGIGYKNKLLPNSSYELYKQNKTYWMNETGISRGIEL